MKAYTIRYKEYSVAKPRTTTVLANNKEDAYYKAWDHLFEYLGSDPYSFWVEGVTYQNGNYKSFNTFEGKPL